MMETTPAPTEILKGLSQIASGYDVLLCDIWGVVHDGEAHHRRAVAALQAFRAKGGVVVLITNAPRPRQPIIDQLDEFKVPRDAYDAIVTSGDVTVGLIEERGTAPLYHIGPERDLALFDEVREATGLTPTLANLDNAEFVVCTGLYDDETETPHDYAESLQKMRDRNLPFICANPDIVVHRGTTLLYCAGALAQAYSQLGGEAIYAGKPYPPIYARALSLAAQSAHAPIDKSRVLAIGDALATDMAGAAHLGVDALLITGGIHRHILHPDEGEAVQLHVLAQFIADKPGDPTYVMRELAW